MTGEVSLYVLSAPAFRRQGHSSIASSYGAAGLMMILLSWLYYSCQILLFGAEFTRVWAMRQDANRKRLR